LLAALLTTCLGVLLYCHVARLCRSWLAGCLAALLFASSCYVLAWYPLAKTSSLSVPLLFGAYMALWEFSSRKALVLAGLLLGLAVDTRLYLIAVLPIFPLYIYSRRRAFPHLAASTGWFLGGLALALAPNLYWALRDPADFYFCNLGFHAIRDQAGLVGAFRQKAYTLLAACGLLRSDEGSGTPFGMLVLLSAAAFVVRLPRARLRVAMYLAAAAAAVVALPMRTVSQYLTVAVSFLIVSMVLWNPTAPAVKGSRGPRAWLAILLAAAIVAVSALPTPTFFQYFGVAVPFLIVGAVTFAWDHARSRLSVAALAVGLLLYLAPLPSDLTRYVLTGVNVMGMFTAENAVNWRLDSLRGISRAIDRRASPGEPVLCFWPGHLVDSHASCVPGMESNVGLFIAPRLSAEQMRKYAILSPAGVRADIARHDPCLVVLSAQESEFAAPYLTLLESSGYKVAYRVGTTSLYACRP
jgi:hypothetical protein